jgi:hypothetical protein
LSSAYAKRAKADLETELEDPNLATVQGMLLLSDYEMSEGHDRVGWIYCGMPLRLDPFLAFSFGTAAANIVYGVQE